MGRTSFSFGLAPGRVPAGGAASGAGAAGFQGVQFGGFLGGVQAGLDQVQRADEPITDAVPTGPDDGVAQRNRPLVFQQDERGRGAIGDVLQDVPVLGIAERVEALRGLLTALDRAGSAPSSPSSPSPMSAPMTEPSSTASPRVRLLRCMTSTSPASSL
jgi:hypothetical protein